MKRVLLLLILVMSITVTGCNDTKEGTPGESGQVEGDYDLPFDIMTYEKQEIIAVNP